MEIIQTFFGLVPITISQSLMYAFVALGVMVPFRILNFPDLTAEGSFPLGGCIFASSMVLGLSPLMALLLAVSSGFLAGVTTAFIHLKFKVNTLLSGILVLTMIYSVNLRAMGRSNVALFSYDNIFTLVSPAITENLSLQILFLVIAVACVMVLLFWLLNTQHGLSMRAVGSNDTMAASQGVGIWTYTIIGLGLANAMTSLGGAILVQSQGFADANMGFGILINGLAALIIGEAITGRKTVIRQLLAPLVGSMVYYQIVSIALALGLQPSDLKFFTGAFVLITLALPSAKGSQVKEKPIRE